MEDITIHPTEWDDLTGNILIAKKSGKIIFMVNENAALNTMSSTGKSMAIASSGGMTKILGGLLFNFWLGKKL